MYVDISKGYAAAYYVNDKQIQTTATLKPNTATINKICFQATPASIINVMLLISVSTY